jgi:uncharacterized protein YsxB (DUF464 family)
MVAITFTEEGNKRIITINGHANYAEKGKDIVCSGISVLYQTYKYFIEDLMDKGKAEDIFLIEEDGFCEFESRNTSLESMTAYEMTKQGLESISETFPDNVKIF